MEWCVYIHTNQMNGKRYVGITCQDVRNRWRNGNGYIECRKMWNAICKYGWDHFDHEIVDEGITKEEAEAEEIELIEKYNTIQNGYNIDKGGNGKMPESIETREHRSESSLRISKPHQGHKNTVQRKRRVMCIEDGSIYESTMSAGEALHVDRLRILKACNYGRPIDGKHFTFIDPQVNKTKQVRCEDLDITFRTVADAARFFNVAENTIRRHCKNGLRLENHSVCFA